MVTKDLAPQSSTILVPGARHSSDFKSEERLIPVIRARLAERLVKEGFRPKLVAEALNVTQAAVTQYIKRKRGGNPAALASIDRLIDPLAEKLVKRLRSGLGGIEMTELMETARQVMVMNRGRTIVNELPNRPERDEALKILRERLRLELTAAEKYLELSNKTADDYSKMLLRMIAADSIRHGDVVSQVISWLEAGRESDFEMPGKAILETLVALEDSAHEASLSKTIHVGHPIARLLFQWIDADEEKHEKIVSKMLKLEADRVRKGSHETSD
jgi:predicted transcriptional regulator/rubrerythrin